jgi:hypothetical protein
MLLAGVRSHIVLCSAVFAAVFSAGLKADSIAYIGANGGAFGTTDLNTGAFTSLGNSGQTPSGLAVANGTLFAASYHTTDGTLYSVNPSNGAFSAIGTATGVDYDDFGSTTSGLYVISFGSTMELYSLNPNTGAATLIGPTGLTYGSWRSLSDNSDMLYFADGADLYTLNTSSGAASLVGAFGGSAEMGALLSENGVLDGGDDVHGTIDTIDIATGAATIGPASGLTGAAYGLAPFPVPTASAPEPASWLLLAAATAGLTFVRRTKTN